MQTNSQSPFFIRAAYIFICLFSFVFLLWVGESVIAPLVYATILAILLNPIVNFMLNRGMNKILAIAITMIATMAICGAFMVFISSQFAVLAETYPKLVQKFDVTTKQLIDWGSRHFNIQPTRINAWIKSGQEEVTANIGSAIGQTLLTIKNMLIVMVIIPVYTFMILFYKPLLLEFIRKVFHTTYHETVVEVLARTKTIIQSYLVGLLIEAVVVATLNSIGLLLLGVEYAIILGITGALLNVIPLVGGVIGTLLPMVIAYVTNDSALSPVFVMLVFMLIQFIDNHYIIPSVVASKVELNALISIIVVIVGGELWGIPGMFLSIPVTAILKVILDHIEGLKPWGFLLGNIVPTKSRFSFNIKKTQS
jgi:predicted PurR-regulated permease PerM